MTSHGEHIRWLQFLLVWINVTDINRGTKHRQEQLVSLIHQTTEKKLAKPYCCGFKCFYTCWILVLILQKKKRMLHRGSKCVSLAWTCMYNKETSSSSDECRITDNQSLRKRCAVIYSFFYLHSISTELCVTCDLVSGALRFICLYVSSFCD